jgi:hypothetical protein
MMMRPSHGAVSRLPHQGRFLIPDGTWPVGTDREATSA